jgi:hypothetical protein
VFVLHDGREYKKTAASITDQPAEASRNKDLSMEGAKTSRATRRQAGAVHAQLRL